MIFQAGPDQVAAGPRSKSTTVGTPIRSSFKIEFNPFDWYSHNYTLYEISFTPPTEDSSVKTTVQRRYSDFVRLDRELRKITGRAPPYPLPSMFVAFWPFPRTGTRAAMAKTKRDQGLIDRRQSELHKYLMAIDSEEYPIGRVSAVWLKFLGLENTSTIDYIEMLGPSASTQITIEFCIQLSCDTTNHLGVTRSLMPRSTDRSKPVQLDDKIRQIVNGRLAATERSLSLLTAALNTFIITEPSPADSQRLAQTKNAVNAADNTRMEILNLLGNQGTRVSTSGGAFVKPSWRPNKWVDQRDGDPSSPSSSSPAATLPHPGTSSTKVGLSSRGLFGPPDPTRVGAGNKRMVIEQSSSGTGAVKSNGTTVVIDGQPKSAQEEFINMQQMLQRGLRGMKRAATVVQGALVEDDHLLTQASEEIDAQRELLRKVQDKVRRA